MRSRGYLIAPWLLISATIAVMVPAGGPPRSARAPAASQAASVPFDTSEWKTDFTRQSVPLAEVMSGGPPKDGIPAIDKPEFVTVAAADEWLKSREPVVFFERGGDARAYPLQILIWHEIANDTVSRVAYPFSSLQKVHVVNDTWGTEDRSPLRERRHLRPRPV